MPSPDRHFANAAIFTQSTGVTPNSGDAALYIKTDNKLYVKNSSGTEAQVTADMVGATSSVAGTAGLVPQPAAGKQNSVLMGDATFLNLDKIAMLPDQVSDCVLWLRSDDLVTSGSNVTTWNNKVNSNKNAGQATATKQPTLVTNQINGLSAVRFDGTDDCLTISSFDLRAEITIFIVAKNASSAKPFWIEHSANTASNDGFYVYGGDSSAMALRRTNRAERTGNANWSGTSWSIYMFKFSDAHTTFFASQNLYPIGLSGALQTSTPANNSSVSATLNIGARDNGASVATSADHAEIIIYNRPLFHFEISCINNYLKNRYAL